MDLHLNVSIFTALFNPLYFQVFLYSYRHPHKPVDPEKTDENDILLLFLKVSLISLYFFTKEQNVY